MVLNLFILGIGKLTGFFENVVADQKFSYIVQGPRDVELILNWEDFLKFIKL